MDKEHKGLTLRSVVNGIRLTNDMIENAEENVRSLKSVAHAQFATLTAVCSDREQAKFDCTHNLTVTGSCNLKDCPLVHEATYIKEGD